jgi:2-hydroxychromene-2-carboxylate isomerase
VLRDLCCKGHWGAAVIQRVAPRLVWYFDFVSPYAYLQFAAHPDLFARDDVTLSPVLFAALLGHWGHKGPAELPTKRVHTYRQIVFRARELNVPLRFPPAHPFNPLHVLRLALALGATREIVRTIFDFIWAEGRSPQVEWRALCQRLGAVDDGAIANEEGVKARLRANTAQAIAAGVFGVPTFAALRADGEGAELFWGEDATAMLRAFLADPALFATPEMQRVSTLPEGARRSG